MEGFCWPHATAIMAERLLVLAGNGQNEVWMNVSRQEIASHNAQRKAQVPSSNSAWRRYFDITIANMAVKHSFPSLLAGVML